jgi:hypothetical protein
MGKQITATLDDGLYDEVTEEHNQTDKSKSRIVNERVRQAYNHEEPSLADSIFPAFGQSLFVAGFVIALVGPGLLGPGVVMGFMGVAMLLGAKADNYATKHSVPFRKAFVHVLGL